jgi:hypothetical protein
MMDRLKGCTVAFTDNLREDDAQRLLDAIALLQGVVSVSRSVDAPEDWMNREKVRIEILAKVWNALGPTGHGT